MKAYSKAIEYWIVLNISSRSVTQSESTGENKCLSLKETISWEMVRPAFGVMPAPASTMWARRGLHKLPI